MVNFPPYTEVTLGKLNIIQEGGMIEFLSDLLHFMNCREIYW